MHRGRIVAVVCLLCGLLAISGQTDARPSGMAHGSAPPINVAAFRDMGHLAFTWQGRPYVLDGTRGRLWALPRSASLLAQPWSSDGRWIAYGEAGQLWLRRADGSGAHSVPGLPANRWAASWLPGGDLLAIEIGVNPLTGMSGLWLSTPTGRPRRLGPVMGFLSPNARTVAYASLLPFRDPTTRTLILSTAPATGGPSTRQLPPVRGAFNLLRWWPDSKGLLYQIDPLFSNSLADDGQPLFSLRLGGRPRSLPTTLGWGDFLSTSPSGRELLLVAGFGRDNWHNKQLAVCGVETATCYRPRNRPGTVALDCAWSPRGDRIAYVQARDLGDAGGFTTAQSLLNWVHSRTLWIADPRGRGAHELRAAGTGIYAPQWAGDGRHLLYLRDDALWLIDSAGGAPIRLLGPLPRKPDLFGFFGHAYWPITLDWSRR